MKAWAKHFIGVACSTRCMNYARLPLLFTVTRPLRNKQMLDEGKPTAVLAFAGGAGTLNMVTQAKAAGLLVIEAPAA